jgi:hypothetical protein
MFGNRDGKAIIQTEAGEVEIFDRDLSRLWFVMSQVMDKADLQIAHSDAELRLERMAAGE